MQTHIKEYVLTLMLRLIEMKRVNMMNKHNAPNVGLCSSWCYRTTAVVCAVEMLNHELTMTTI